MSGEEKDPVLLAAAEVALALAEEPPAKDFLLLAEAMEKDESVQTLRQGIEQAQREMMRAAERKDDEGYAQAKSRYRELSAAFSSHPVVMNFQAAIEALTPLLEEIENKLQ